MSEHYEVHQLSGYTDGKPSWRKVHVPYSHTFSKEGAAEAIEALKVIYPAATFRVRKSSKPLNLRQTGDKWKDWEWL